MAPVLQELGKIALSTNHSSMIQTERSASGSASDMLWVLEVVTSATCGEVRADVVEKVDIGARRVAGSRV